jgi:hypothetical protein
MVLVGIGIKGKKRIVVILIVTHYMKMRKGLKGMKSGNEGGKASLTPLWRFVTKLEGGKGVEPLNFYVIMIVIKENLIPVHIC